MDDLRAKFNKKYANLPFGARDEIIAVVDNEPFTWNSARVEIDRDKPTPKGEKILKQLHDLSIL